MRACTMKQLCLLWVALLCLLLGAAFGARAQILPQILYSPHHAAACGTLNLALNTACDSISIPTITR